jgi:predicted Zn-ribbon and HTH transcriptional regulator
MNDNQKKSMAESLAKMYDLDGIEGFIEDPKCGKCGLEALQRCSLCKSEWYCGRQCQVKAWKSHKPICELVRGKIQI